MKKTWKCYIDLGLSRASVISRDKVQLRSIN